MELSLKRLIIKKESQHTIEVMGIHFPNPIGLCKGVSERYNSSSSLKFGFIEVGPFTPKPQVPEKKHSLFGRRQNVHNANRGIKYIISRIQHDKPKGILSVLIAHNNSSIDEDNVAKDYFEAYSMVYDFADIISIDSSITNQDGSHPLQDPSFLSDILDSLLEIRLYYDTYKPIVLKISSDISSDRLEEIVSYCMMSRVDGICVLNGRNALKTLEEINTISKSRIPVIMEGDNLSPDDISVITKSGATLIQTTKKWWQSGNRYFQNLKI